MYFLISLEISSLTDVVFRSVVLGSKGLEISFLSFCYWFLVWFPVVKNTHTLISVHLNLLRFVLRRGIRSIMVYVPLEKNVYSAVGSLNVHRSCCPMVLLSYSISFLIFYVSVLSIAERGLLKSPTTVVDLPISLFSFISFCFMHFPVLLFCAHIFRITMSSWQIEPFVIM